jgi:Acyl-CoA dehydrogenase, C-terminal domain
MIEADELDVFREGLRQATATSSGAALELALDELGWRDALAADRRAAVSTLFELLGRANAASSALDVVLLDALGWPSKGAGVVLPPLGSSAPPGHLEGETITVLGSGSASLERQARALVVVSSNGEHIASTVDIADLVVRSVEGLDREMGLVEVTARARVEGTEECRPGAWEAAIAAGRLALSHQLVGASRAMLELASEHARERVQFGRPIAAFQAVRHRLAESLVAIEAADAALCSAWEDGSALTAALVKAIAGRSARTVAGHCQQVLAGMGFTTEHPFHRYLRRTILLDQCLGDSRTLFHEVGEGLLEARALPALLPL